MTLADWNSKPIEDCLNVPLSSVPELTAAEGDCLDDLLHYGIPGMKWGVRRTPEELGHRRAERALKRRNRKMQREKKKRQKAKLKAQKEAAKKAKNLEEWKKSPTKMYQHRDEYSLEELEKRNRVFEQHKKLSDYSVNTLSLGQQYLDTIVKYGKTGIEGYNTVARVYNTRFPNQTLPYVPNPGGNNDEKKKRQEKTMGR